MIKWCPCCGQDLRVPFELDFNLKRSWRAILYTLIAADGKIVRYEKFGYDRKVLFACMSAMRVILRNECPWWTIENVYGVGYKLVRNDVLQRQRTEGCTASREGSPAQGGSAP